MTKTANAKSAPKDKPLSFSAKSIDYLKTNSDCLILPCFEKDEIAAATEAVDKATQGEIKRLIKREKFQAKAGQNLLLLSVPQIAAERVLLLGFGSKDVSVENFRKALGKLSDLIKSLPCKDITISLDDLAVKEKSADWIARQITEQLGQLGYTSDQLKSKKSDTPLALQKIHLGFHKSDLTLAEKGITIGQAVVNGINLARRLGDLPGNICTPTYLADTAKKLSAKNALKLTVLEEKDMKALGMGSLLSVAAGSDQPAKLIVMEYQGDDKKAAPYALVGKGITFDTGGISLKPGPGMDEMKFDMCGAASVLGTLQAVIELKLPINVIGVIAASENMPNGKATKPGDIVTSMSGQTIEILNTDAEGRLVLCDALTYTEKFKPKTVIDIATLTGACVIALGNHASGLFSNNEALSNEIVKAGTEAGDRAWPMPLWDDYQKQLDSNFADIANIGGKEGGSITAACFLSRFTKNMKWAHLDIAGTAWKSGSAKGATGRPVGLLVQYLLNQIN
jgi:leucyl aminopeptidase